jgi:hypothetical protein
VILGPTKNASAKIHWGFFFCVELPVFLKVFGLAQYIMLHKKLIHKTSLWLGSHLLITTFSVPSGQSAQHRARLKFFYLIFQTDVYCNCALKVMYVLLQLFYTTFWIGWIKQGSLHDLNTCLVLFKVNCIGTPKSDRQITYACNTFCSCIGTGQFW